MTILSLLSLASMGTQYTITNSGNTFTPDSITINAGDTVIFSIGSFHDAVEVSEETYNENGNTPNGGFSVPFGGGTITLESAGTHYYVCEPHASIGMKGIIQVVIPSDLEFISNLESTIKIFPNPATDHINLAYTLTNPSPVKVTLLSITGVEMVTLVSEYQRAGSQLLTKTLDEKLNPGIYFIHLNTVKGTLVRKLVIE